MKKIFLADLDNTLIYSYKHAKEGDVCVEMLKGKPQGFISAENYARLKGLQERYTVIPVTSRSIEQYGRIQLPVTPAYAVVANGGWLLKDGVVDEAWRKETEAFIAPYREEMQRVAAFLEAQELFLRVRIVDDTFLFAYCKDEVDIASYLASAVPNTSLTTVASGRKLYFFPPQINKGEASRRILRMLKTDKAAAAGDSSIDAPMLAEAELAIVPKGYPVGLLPERQQRAVCQDGEFCNFVLETVKRYFEI